MMDDATITAIVVAAQRKMNCFILLWIFHVARVARNIGILPVSSNGHPAWSAMSRLGSLRDASGWKPKLL
jgi:hypothetical protein